VPPSPSPAGTGTVGAAADNAGQPLLLAGGLGLLLLLFAVGLLAFVLLGREPTFTTLGEALLVAGVAEIIAGMALRRGTGWIALMLVGAASLIGGFLLLGQADLGIRRFSRELMGPIPGHTIIILWLLVRAILQAGYCVIRGHNAAGLWISAFIAAAAGILLVAKVPSVSALWILFGLHRDLLLMLGSGVGLGLMASAIAILTLARAHAAGRHAPGGWRESEAG